jgi:two-component system, NtrC family, sensor kinase
MRIGTRLWTYVVAASFAVLLVATTLRLRDEREMLEQSTFEDRRFFGEALAAALEAGQIASTDQVREAFAHGLRAHGELVEVSTRDDSSVRDPSRDEPQVTARAGGIVTSIPFEHDGVHSVLSLVERVAPQRAIEQRSVLHSVGSMAALGAVQMLIVWVLAGRLVSAPLARFGAGARRVAAGDLSERLAVVGDDELAAFAREFNAMADALAHARENLEQQASARAALLEQLRHGERLRMVGMLSSSLAHELGTPLGIIAMQVSLLERAERLSPAQRVRTQAVTEQVARMKAIVQNMLGFARRRTPRRSDLDLREVAEHAVVMLEPLARKHGVNVRVAAGRGAVVSADETQLLQALTNLLVNAFHAMPKGGEVVVEAQRVPASAEIGAHARLAVRDQGTGIAPEVRAHLFDPFFTTKQAEGTGLGLTVTAGIVADLGGSIEIESELGRGSVFTIELPLSGAEHAWSARANVACV